MDCDYCNLPAEFTCNCNYPILCSEHLARHVQNHNGQFLVEALNVFHSNEKSQALKNEALTRIKELEKSKRKLFALSNSMINEIVSHCNKAVKNYDIHIQFYLKLIRFKKLSCSLEIVFKKMMDTVLIIKEASEKTRPFFEEYFKQELILIPRGLSKEEIQRKLVEEKKRKIEAEIIKKVEDEVEEIQRKLLEEKKRKTEAELNKRIEDKVNELEKKARILEKELTELNILAVDQGRQVFLLKRKEILISLGFNFPQEFSNSFINIEFSRDSHFVFICKI